MARGTQLIEIVRMLRGEISRSTNVAVGVDDVEGLKIKIQDRQVSLYDDYDWPFMRERFSVPLLTNVRYYDTPSAMNTERIEQAWTYYGLLPRKIERGITEDNYAAFNSDNGVVADPALRYDLVSTGDTTSTSPHLEQIEIWPVPASNNQTMILRGLRSLRPLLADSDVADLDDLLIVYLTAAELLQKAGAGSAGVLKSLAEQRLTKMRGRFKVDDKRYRFGMGEAQSRPNKIVVRAS